jgi:pyruvate-formate lyase
MANSTKSPPPQVLWNTFDDDRGPLFDQFQNIEYDPSTGLPPQEIQMLIQDFVSQNPQMPRVLVKAHSFRIVLENCMLNFNRASWFACDFRHGGLLLKQRQVWYDELEAGPLADEAKWFEQVFSAGALRGRLDFHHVAPGWENLFESGLQGLVDRAEGRLNSQDSQLDDGQRAFLASVTIVCRAATAFAQRFSAYLIRLADSEDEHQERVLRVADVLLNVPAHRPNGLHEALQAMWLTQMFVELEGETTMSFGHFDRMLYPYYASDLEQGRLTRDQAKELLKHFWLMFHARRRGEGDSARNFTFAGQTREGTDATNELTYLALEAIEELNTPEPKASIRFFSGTPDRLYRRVAELIQKGRTSMVLMNDGPSVAGLVERGKTLEDARSYLSIGCYEPAIDGKDMACTMNIPVNLAKGIELTFNNGTDPLTGAQLGVQSGAPEDFTSFGQVFDAYKRQMDSLLERAHRYLTRYEPYWCDINPSPFIASTLDDCIDRAQDIGEGGCVYNSVGCPAGALAETADSLLAVKRAVFDEGKYSMRQLADAMAADFAGSEQMRMYLQNHVAKWGTNDSEADDMAVRVGDYYCDKIHTFRTTRGGPYQAGLFALHFQWTFGQRTGALPCGRKAGTPTAPGISAGAGMDTKGITSLMGSLAKLDYSKAPDGSVLDLMLHPSTIGGPEGVENLAALIRTHFDRGGNYLQFNIVDTDTLEDAQRNPERHAGLQVRITGYSAYFTKISRYEQDLFIRRVKHAM